MTRRRGTLDRLFDLAVAVPTCTFVAATRAVPIAARVGTFGTARLVGRVSDAVHELRHGDEIDSAVEHAAAELIEPTVATTSTDEAVSVEDLPIDGYDDLAARQVVDRLTDLDPAALAQVEMYERAHRGRSTVLGKISMLSA